MNDRPEDPTLDPQLADAWRALSELLASAEAPADTDALAAQIARRVERQARQRLWRRGAGVLAVAASLLVVAGFALYASGGRQIAAMPAPQQQAIAQDANPEPITTAGGDLEIPPWHDELDDATAALAAEIQSTAERWRQPADGITTLEAQIYSFEEELRESTL